MVTLAPLGPDGATVTVTGVLVAVTPRQTAAGYPWCLARLHTTEGLVLATVPPRSYAQCGPLLVDQVVTLTGRVDGRGYGPPRLTVITVDHNPISPGDQNAHNRSHSLGVIA